MGGGAGAVEISAFSPPFPLLRFTRGRTSPQTPFSPTLLEIGWCLGEDCAQQLFQTYVLDVPFCFSFAPSNFLTLLSFPVLFVLSCSRALVISNQTVCTLPPLAHALSTHFFSWRIPSRTIRSSPPKHQVVNTINRPFFSHSAYNTNNVHPVTQLLVKVKLTEDSPISYIVPGLAMNSGKIVFFSKKDKYDTKKQENGKKWNPLRHHKKHIALLAHRIL